MANEKVFITEQILKDIAAAIYNQEPELDGLRPIDFANAINNMSTGTIPDMILNNGYVEAIYTATTKDLQLRNR